MSTGESSRVEPSYRNSYGEHTKHLLNLIQQTSEELNHFRKWVAVEDDAANFARDFSSNLYDIADLVNANIRATLAEKKEVMEALEFNIDELGYPESESEDESAGGESYPAMNGANVLNHTNGTSDLTRVAIKVEDEGSLASSWKGKEKEINPPHHMAVTEIPSAPSKGKGKEPEVPYPIPFNRSTGESSRTRLDDSDPYTASSNDLLAHYIKLLDKMVQFQASWASRNEGRHYLSSLAMEMKNGAERFMERIRRITDVENSLTLNGDHDATINRPMRTSKSHSVSSQDKGEKTTPEVDSSERKPPRCKIVIPARRPQQLPPKEMRKSKKLLDSFQFDSDVGDELEGEVKIEEVSPRIESISQAIRPVERRTRYNLRSDSRKKNVAGPSRTKDEPGPVVQTRNKKKEQSKPQVNERAGRKRHIEDEEESSHKDKKRRRVDGVKKRETKKETLLNKRKRDDDNENEGAKTRKRTKRN